MLNAAVVVVVVAAVVFVTAVVTAVVIVIEVVIVVEIVVGKRHRQGNVCFERLCWNLPVTATVTVKVSLRASPG